MTNRDTTRDGPDDRLTRRRCLALAALGATGLAGCSSGGGGDGDGGDGNDGGDGGDGNDGGDGGDGNDGGDGGDGGDGSDSDGGSDPFRSVEVGPQVLTAELERGVEVDAVAAEAVAGEARSEVDVERGVAEIPVSTVGDCGSCPEFEVHLPDGAYELVALQIPEDDAERPTEVGRRSVTIERRAAIAGIEQAEDHLAVTIENTGDLLIRVRMIRYEPTDPDALDAPADWYTRTEGEGVLDLDRTDSTDHDLKKTENRPVIENIVVPGSDGVFALSQPSLYRTDEMSSESACTGQSVDLRFEAVGQGDGDVVRAAATGTLAYDGEVTRENDDSFACSTLTVENLTDVES